MKSADERFWAKVNKTDGCWLWLGGKTLKGYGVFAASPGRFVGAHRFSYEASKGTIPNGLEIDHLCRNHPCVNPDHLEAVTPSENVMRGLSPEAARQRGAKVTHCPAGHEYTPENTKIHRGRRSCKCCNKLRMRAKKLREISHASS